jgi:hypothetical protein
MKKEDFVIQSEVRRMVIRSSIDYSKIDYGTVKGVVYFRGFFRLSMAMDSHEELKRTLTVKALFSFEKKIRNIPGVSDVVFQFANWRREKGQWVSIKSMRIEEKREEKGEGKPEAKKEEKGAGEDESKTAPVI